MASVLPSEPSIEPVLRDLALGGHASEYALSTLADARPLLVELDVSWSKRVVSHLYVEGLWLRYAPQPLGDSDRQPSRLDPLAAQGSLSRALRAGQVRDDATAKVVAQTLKQHAAALSLAGEPADANAALDRVAEWPEAGSFVTGARLRLAFADKQKHRSVELRDLLRF